MQVLLSTRIESVPKSDVLKVLGHDFRFNMTKNVSNSNYNKAFVFLNNSNNIEEYEFSADEHLRNNNIKYFDNSVKNVKLANSRRDLLVADLNESIENIENHIRSQVIEKTGKKRSLGNFNPLQMGVLTFGVDEETRKSRADELQNQGGLTDEEVEYINSLNKKDMDKCMLDYIKNFENTYNVKVKYVTRHDDEKTVHYHFLFENYDFDLGKSFKSINCPNKSVARQFGVDLQDLAGESFAPLNITRGVSKHITGNNHKDINEMRKAEYRDYLLKSNNLNNNLQKLENSISIKRSELLNMSDEIDKNKELIKQYNNMKNDYKKMRSEFDKETIMYKKLGLKVKELQLTEKEYRDNNRELINKKKSLKTEVDNLESTIQAEYDNQEKFKNEVVNDFKNIILENTNVENNKRYIKNPKKFLEITAELLIGMSKIDVNTKEFADLKSKVDIQNKELESATTLIEDLRLIADEFYILKDQMDQMDAKTFADHEVARVTSQFLDEIKDLKTQVKNYDDKLLIAHGKNIDLTKKLEIDDEYIEFVKKFIVEHGLVDKFNEAYKIHYNKNKDIENKNIDR